MKKFFRYFFLSLGILIVVIAGDFFLVRTLDSRVMEMKGLSQPSYIAAAPVLLPSQFINGERFYIKMPTVTGDTLMAYGDSGGGLSMILPAVVDKLKIRSKVKMALMKGVMPVHYIPFRDLVNNMQVPAPLLLRSMVLRRPFSMVSESFLFVPAMDGEMKFITKVMPFDIFLGQNFFMGKAWTFDYIHRQIWVNTPIAAGEAGNLGVQHLGFKKNSNNEAVFGHPSMTIEVDGEVIDVLFDSGATIVLSENGKKLLGTSEKTIGGSFIAASVFDKWRKTHPGWKYYPKADMDRDVIEVPVVKIGGYEVGPVLFAKRPDEAWSRGMIQSMDKVVKGAVGGSAFKYFKVTIDYNSELVKFEK